MSAADLASRIADLAAADVTCVGDVLLDRFVEGSVDRISPEAPIPVLSIHHEQEMLGGAGNVARNLAALGARCRFVSVVGEDEAGARVARLTDAEPRVDARLIPETGRRTGIKTRYVAQAQQLLRTDAETVAPIGDSAGDAVRSAADSGDVLVLSDYGKGVLHGGLVGDLIATARAAGRPVVVDPKGRDFRRYRGASVIAPNRKELAEATGMATESDDDIVAAARHLIASCGVDAVLATRGARGMTLVEKEAAGTVLHLPAEARDVFDVSGAGDTVVATIAAALSAGMRLADAARIANVAGGIVVGKVGTAVATAADLRAALRRLEPAAAEDKIVTRDQAADRVGQWRRQGLRVGFTNGCFDILHPGHVSLLAQAGAACDRLVVGVNSDSSVARLKGPGRPVQPETARALVLAAMAEVDQVVVFAEDTPLALIQALRPDLLVKGADYAVGEVVGADVVRGYGGRVMLAEFVAGYSSSAIIDRSGAADD